MMLQILVFSAALSVLKNPLTNEVRIEESWLALNLGYRRIPSLCSENRGAAAGEDTSDGIP